MMKFLNAIILTLLISSTIQAQTMKMEMSKNLERYAADLVANTNTINPERQEQLKELATDLTSVLKETDKHDVIFVCTHNSRRSHLADLWFRFALMYYGVNEIGSFSGGTEATAFNPRAIAAMKRAGFKTSYDKSAENPTVSISPLTYPVWNVRSKVYADDANPKSNFTAVMVCSDADRACPIVAGATQRFAIPYNDPKHYDGTPSEEAKYDETVKLIGTEMMFLVDQIKKQLILVGE